MKEKQEAQFHQDNSMVIVNSDYNNSDKKKNKDRYSLAKSPALDLLWRNDWASGLADTVGMRPSK